MTIDFGALAPILSLLLPTLLGAISPLITNLVERGVATFNAKLPNPLKPAINAVIGAILAGLSGANPVAGVVGAQIGNRVRESLNKDKEEKAA